MLNLKNKKILIMGCGALGDATAQILSEFGSKVIISDTNKLALDRTFLKLSGSKHRKALFDIAQIDKIKNFMVDIVKFDNAKLDGLVYAVDKNLTASLMNTSLELLQDVMMVNFFAFVEVVKAFVDEEAYNLNSSIVAVSNYASLGADKGQIAYGASKAAMDNSMSAIAKEIYHKGIRINSIRPAIVQSDKQLSEREKELVAMMQTGPIDPKILAQQIAFLLSDASSGVYGRHFDVRGYLV